MSDVRLHIDEGEFTKIIDLVNAQPWLAGKKESLFELLSDCPTPDHKELVIDLLQRTLYIDSSLYISSIDALRNQIEVVWNLDANSTFFVSSNHKQTTDSSQEVLNQLKSCAWATDDWSSKKFYTRYRDVVPLVKVGDVILIVDDFIGGGGTMLKALDWFYKKSGLQADQLDLRVASVSGCEEGIKKISDTGIDIYVKHVVPKAISSHFNGNDLVKAIELMKNLEDILQSSLPDKALSKFRFGWDKQEAVFYRQGGNTPNNVFPIMWWRKTNARVRRTIMNRTL